MRQTWDPETNEVKNTEIGGEEEQKPFTTYEEMDLDKKEKKRRERARRKEMTWKQRLGFFWDYYKWVPLVILAALVAIHEGIGIYQRAQQKTLISIAIMDTAYDTEEEAKALSADLAAFLGSGDPHEIVALDTVLPSGDSPAAVTKQTMVVAAGLTDVLVVGEEAYTKFQAQGTFLPWKNVLGEEYEKLSGLFDQEGRLDASQSPVWQAYALTDYSPAYVCVLVGAEHPEAAAGLAGFLAG